MFPEHAILRQTGCFGMRANGGIPAGMELFNRHFTKENFVKY